MGQSVCQSAHQDSSELVTVFGDMSQLLIRVISHIWWYV